MIHAGLKRGLLSVKMFDYVVVRIKGVTVFVNVVFNLPLSTIDFLYFETFLWNRYDMKVNRSTPSKSWMVL